MTAHLMALLTSILPDIRTALGESGERSAACAKRAVRKTTAWFLGGEIAPSFKGRELDDGAVGRLIQSAFDAGNLPELRAGQAVSALTELSHSLHAAVTGCQVIWGGTRHRQIEAGEAEIKVRAAILRLIRCAVLWINGDEALAFLAVELASGKELDLEALGDALSTLPMPFGTQQPFPFE